jgi:hypothetical protein
MDLPAGYGADLPELVRDEAPKVKAAGGTTTGRKMMGKQKRKREFAPNVYFDLASC